MPCVNSYSPRSGAGQTSGDSKGGEVIGTEPLLVKGGVDTLSAKSFLLRLSP